MKVAALYDIHGNLPALEAVLAEIEGDLVVVGGDVVWGSWPRETLERLLALGDRVLFLRGNTDRAVLRPEGESTKWAAERLGPTLLAELERWPETIELELEGLGRVLFCHATPRDDEEILLPSFPPEGWVEALRGVEADVVVGGHTHVQFEHSVGRIRFVNPGSVGNPVGAPVAHWARLGPMVELRSTAYDAAATAAAMRETGFPRSDFADELERPWTLERAVEYLTKRAGL